MKTTLPTELLPREKLLRYGANALSDSELLALFLRTGTKASNVFTLSQQLLFQFGSLTALINSEFSQFKRGQGIGVAKYVQLQAVVELSRRYLKERLSAEPVFTHPHQLYHFLASSLSDRPQEVFLVLFLDNQNKMIVSEEMFVGTYNAVQVHPREIVRLALKYNAASLVLAHNHPSGQPEPSLEDRNLTEYIIKTCQLFDISIIDHIIIGKGNYVSFAQRGWI